MSGQITTAPLVRQLQKLAKRKDISAIVLRVDSPGAPSRPFNVQANIMCLGFDGEPAGRW